VVCRALLGTWSHRKHYGGLAVRIVNSVASQQRHMTFTTVGLTLRDSPSSPFCAERDT